MLKSIGLLIITIGIGFLSSHLYPHFGEVNIFVAGLKVSLPLGLAISLIIATFILFNLLVRPLFGMYGLAKKIMQVVGGTDQHLASARYNKAMHAYYAGNYTVAQNLFIKAARGFQEPLINYLQAAKCAHNLKKYTVRDKLLLSCYTKFVDKVSLINFSYAQMCYEQGDYEKGLALLLAIDQQEVNFAEYLKLKANLLYRSNNFSKLAKLLPELNKIKTFDEQDLIYMQVPTYEYKLQQASSMLDVQQTWQEIPKKLRALPQVIAPYVTLVSKFNVQEAELILRKAIDYTYNSQLVDLYGTLEANLPKQIAAAETWYKEHADDYALNLCLGRLCTNYKLWGKAKDYLEKSVNIKPNFETFMQYARLCSLMGDNAAELKIIERSLVALHY